MTVRGLEKVPAAADKARPSLCCANAPLTVFEIPGETVSVVLPAPETILPVYICGVGEPGGVPGTNPSPFAGKPFDNHPQSRNTRPLLRVLPRSLKVPSGRSP